MSLYTDASLIMFPSGYKEDKIYSLKPTDGAGDLTFTRASTATRVNAEGLIETSPVNLLQSSETFNLSPWATNAGATITANSTIAPNGTTTADTLTAAALSSSGIYQVRSTIAGQVYNASLYVKNNSGATSVKYQEENSAAGILFNATTGVITGTLGTVISSSVENVGNGWYKIQFAYTSTNPTNIFLIYSNLVVVNSFFIWGAQLNIGATAKPYFPTTDRLNVPRIDYTGGGCGSLLLEKQSTNSQTYSEDLTDGSAWGLGSTTISANSIISPDGTQNADKLVEDSSTNRHELYGKSLTYSGTSSVSFFAKLGERRYFSAFVAGNPALGGATFDLQTGTITATSGGTNANIEEYSNGWYRCSFTTTATATTTLYICLRTNGGAPNIETYAGDGVSGIYFWGGQTEIASSYPTSYIPTLASSVTRLADAAYKTGVSSLIGQTQGTLFFEGVIDAFPMDNSFFGVEKTASNFVIRFGSGGSSIYAQSYNGSSNLFFEPTAYTLGTRVKLAFAYQAGNYAFYKNGTLVATGTNAGTIPACDSVMTNSLWGYVGNGKYSTSQAIVFPTTLTNTQLAELTTL